MKNDALIEIFNNPDKLIEYQRNCYLNDLEYCFYCGIDIHNFSLFSMLFGYLPPDNQERTEDHIIPRCKGGSNDRDNRVGACRDCNNKKGRKSLEEFLEIGVDQEKIDKIKKEIREKMKRF